MFGDRLGPTRRESALQQSPRDSQQRSGECDDVEEDQVPGSVSNPAVTRLGAQLELELGALTGAMHTEMTERITELRGDAALLELLRVSINSNLTAIVQVLTYRIEPDQVPTPLGAREYARRLAQHGVSVTALVRAYRLGQRRLLEWALNTWEESGETASLDAMGELIRTVSGYIDSISEQVIAEYDAEREQWLAHRDRARADVLAQLLRGGDVDIDLAERVLGYRLRGRHLGAILWVDEGDTAPGAGVFEGAASALGAVVGRGAHVVWQQDATSAWIWLPVSREVTWTTQDLSAAIAHVPAVRAALGAMASGASGFRATHEDARAARQVAGVAGAAARLVTSYDEPGVRAAALLAADLPRARRMVAHTLGGLANDDEATARLRETVLTLLQEKGNYVTTAERLHLHKNTVKYRIRRAAELRGRTIDDDRLDLELALQASAWLGTAVLPG